jgi:hypothetical protein
MNMVWGDEVQKIARRENRTAYALLFWRIYVGEGGFCIRSCGEDEKIDLQISEECRKDLIFSPECLCHGELGWVVELSAAPTTELSRIAWFWWIDKIRKLVLSEKLCKGWISIANILISWILWVEAESVGIHVVCYCCIAFQLGLVELENKGPGLRSVLLSCCRIVKWTHVRILLSMNSP